MIRNLLSLFSLGVPALLWGQMNDFDKLEFQMGMAKLPYRLLKPSKLEADKKYPLVLFLHGAGERGTDNAKQLIHGGSTFLAHREKFPAFVLFPQCPDGNRWVEVNWSDKDPHTTPAEPSPSMRLVRQLLDKLLAEQPIDAKRIYIMGLSMGGFGTWDFLTRYPELVAAAVPICGGADNSAATKIKDIPIWVFHGEKDTVVHTVRSKSIVEALKKQGSQVKYTEFPRVAHNSWTPALQSEELFPWLFSQKRK
jgi:predicted peptidase